MALLSPAPYPFKSANEVEIDKELEAMLVVSDSLPPGEVVGGVLRFLVADGYAFYYISAASPLTVQHVPFGDQWTISAANVRGITLDDALGEIAALKAYRAKFA